MRAINRYHLYASIAALWSVHCGDGATVEDPAPPAGPTSIAGARIVTTASLTFNAESYLAGFDDMSGAGFATTWEGATLRACSPVFGPDGSLYFVHAGGLTRLDLESGAAETLAAANGVDLTALWAVAFDDQGRIYATDGAGSRVIRIDDMSGAGLVTLGGSPGSGVGAFDEPRGIAVRASGAILIADSKNGRLVQVDDMDGAGWTTWSMPPQPEVSTARPAGVAIDAMQRIYVVDFNGNSALHRIDDIDGSGAVRFRALGFGQMAHVALGPDDRIFLGLLNGLSLVAAMDDMAGTGLVSYAGPEGAPFMNPCGIAAR